VAARKFVLFGLLRDVDGNVVGPDSVQNRNLVVGESIGGPFEDTAGPALNNFIKFVAVFAFVTGGPGQLYDEEPNNTWPLGIVCVILSLTLVAFARFGLTVVLRVANQLVKRRQRQKAFEEGEAMDLGEDEDEGDEFDTHVV